MNTTPPLGLVPRYLHEEKRFNDVCEAIARYYQAGMKLPVEWIQEYNDLIESYNKRKPSEEKKMQEAVDKLNIDL